MGSLLSAISADIKEYVELCEHFGIEPQRDSTGLHEPNPYANDHLHVLRIQMEEERKKTIAIYGREISLEVVIPGGYHWEFMADFGHEFKMRDLHDGIDMIRPVTRYFDHPNGWHVTVTIWEGDEERFKEFLRKFADDRGYSFRDSTVRNRAGTETKPEEQ